MPKRMSKEEKSIKIGQWYEEHNPNFKYLNVNPDKKIAQDCAIRAITTAEQIPYEQVEQKLLNKLIEVGYRNYHKHFEAYLNDTHKRIIIPKPKKGGHAVRVCDFMREHPQGRYIITTHLHATCVVNGILYDLWDPSDKVVNKVWEVEC